MCRKDGAGLATYCNISQNPGKRRDLPDLTRWDAEAIAWVAQEVRAFESDRRPKSPAKKVA